MPPDERIRGPSARLQRRNTATKAAVIPLRRASRPSWAEKGGGRLSGRPFSCGTTTELSTVVQTPPHLCWITCQLEACYFTDWACGTRGQVLNGSAGF